MSEPAVRAAPRDMGHGLLNLILEPAMTHERFVTWYEVQKTRLQRSPQGPDLPEAWGPSQALDLSGLKPELGLVLINFIRDEIARILAQSQSGSDTPASRAPLTASKYDYTSPTKAVRGRSEPPPVLAESSSESGKKKRVQLFTAPSGPDRVESDDNLLDVRALADETSAWVGDSERQNQLEERLNAGPTTGELKILTTNARSQPSRRSLDSIQAERGRGHPKERHLAKSNSTPKLNLGDFIQVKKAKRGKKGQQSRSPLNPGSDSGAELATGSSAKSEPEPVQVSKHVINGIGNASDDVKVKIRTLAGRFSEADAKPADPTLPALVPVSPELAVDSDPSDIWSQISASVEKSRLITHTERPSPPMLDQHPVAQTPQKSARSMDLLVPDPEQITHLDDIEKLVQLYSYCLDRNMVPNVAVELYLMVELLMVQAKRSPEGPKSQTERILDSIHNCVYFAVRFFELQSVLLDYLELDLLKILSDNSRIAQFSPELMIKITKIVFKKCQKEDAQECRTIYSKDRVLESVRFQMETDNLKNFPSDRLFQDFKKQRDLFYEILRDYEEPEKIRDRRPSGKAQKGRPHPNQPLTRAEKLDAKILQLVSLRPHPVNYLHLAQLLHNQLMTTCVSETMECLFDEDLSFDKGINPRKLRQLQSRFEATITGPQGSQSILKPRFPGAQEFYRCFIQTSNNHSFLHHLKNCLVRTIQIHDAISFTLDNFGLDGDSTELTPNDLGQFSTSLITLRIAAKFLGFIESLPFQISSEHPLSDPILANQVAGRLMFPQSIDVEAFLKSSIQKSRLTLTLPWIIEFCSNLDGIALESRQYQDFFKLLVNVYKSVLMPQRNDQMFGSNRFMLNLTLGCFFENPFIPRELFFNYPTHSQSVLDGILRDCPKSTFNTKPLDKCALISPKLLMVCCPYLSELKKVAGQIPSGHKEDCSLSHSVALLNVRSDLRGSGKGLALEDSRRRANLIQINSSPTGTAFMSESDLRKIKEDHFFYNQAPSLRKTVEFVYDRVASKLIHSLTSDRIPTEQRRIKEDIRENLSMVAMSISQPEDLASKEMAAIKGELIAQLKSLTRSTRANFLKSAVKSLQSDCLESCERSLQALLIEDIADEARKTLRDITVYHAMRITTKWMKDHITFEYFYNENQNELDSLWEAGSRGPLANVRSKDETAYPISPFNPAKATPSEMFIKLKGVISRLSRIRDGDGSQPRDVIQSIERVAESIQDPLEEIPAMTLKGLQSITLDYCLFLLTFAPKSMIAEVQEAFIRLWKVGLGPPRELASLLSTANFACFNRSPEASTTWYRMEHFLNRLLKAGLVAPLVLEDQCMQLLRSEWPEELLKKFASCMKSVVETYKLENQNRDDEEGDFSDLLDWMLWFWQDLHDAYEDDFPAL
eukprot:maker-scaffold478_size161223-snap-gene-0.25 protein:Tk02251 transcript:maker-scaffold478_size161223-snap-gene-0.25-mRNA-1 annotation:"PREDICTED: codanin-1"